MEKHSVCEREAEKHSSFIAHSIDITEREEESTVHDRIDDKKDASIQRPSRNQYNIYTIRDSNIGIGTHELMTVQDLSSIAT
jgi:hypothetical protein